MSLTAGPRAPARPPETRLPGGRFPGHRFEVLGVPVDALDMETAVLRIARLVAGHEPGAATRYVCIRDVNGIMECRKDPELLRIHRGAGNRVFRS